jgi:hypothetical protein
MCSGATSRSLELKIMPLSHRPHHAVSASVAISPSFSSGICTTHTNQCALEMGVKNFRTGMIHLFLPRCHLSALHNSLFSAEPHYLSALHNIMVLPWKNYHDREDFLDHKGTKFTP